MQRGVLNTDAGALTLGGVLSPWKEICRWSYGSLAQWLQGLIADNAMACCPCLEGMLAREPVLELRSRQVPVSALILGSAPMGCGWAGAVSERTAESTVLEALEKGIRYVDTAPWYGGGLSCVLTNTT